MGMTPGAVRDAAVGRIRLGMDPHRDSICRAAIGRNMRWRGGVDGSAADRLPRNIQSGEAAIDTARLVGRIRSDRIGRSQFSVAASLTIPLDRSDAR